MTNALRELVTTTNPELLVLWQTQNPEFWQRIAYAGLDSGRWASSDYGYTRLLAVRKTGKYRIEDVHLPEEPPASRRWSRTG